MNATIPEPLLRQFSDFLATRMGLYFPPARWGDMLHGLERAARQFGLPGAAACMRWLMAAPLDRAQVETLASHLTVGETYFYREPAVFAALEQHVLPPLVAARAASDRRLRIWSAGCCTGEEPYSLAILLSRLIPDIERWNLTLLATDINPQFLARAARGEFRDWSFRAAPPWLREGYFTPAAAETVVIRPRIRELVSFAYLNLVDDVYPSLASNTNGMDLILCRNVLMYFEADAMRAVVDKLHRCLGDGGWLVVSPFEAGAVPFDGFTAVDFADAVLYRKGAADPVPAPAVAPEAVTEWIAMPSSPVPPRPPAVTGGSAAAPARTSDAPYRRALACYAHGAYAQAAELLAAAPARDAPGLALAARACANLGRLDEARRWGEAAVAADKCNPGLRYLLASVLAEQDRDDAAAAALKQALYLDQDFVLAHFALGNLYRREGRATPAARHFASVRTLLGRLPPTTPLPEGEGLTAGRLLAMLGNAEPIA